jgi:DNA repair exonuclease SbcCD ATPase subunit
MDRIAHKNKLQYPPALPCRIKTVESKDRNDIKKYKQQIEIQQQEINNMRSEIKALNALIAQKNALMSHYEQIAGIVLNSEEKLLDATKKLYEQDALIESLRAKEDYYKAELNETKSAMETMQNEASSKIESLHAEIAKRDAQMAEKDRLLWAYANKESDSGLKAYSKAINVGNEMTREEGMETAWDNRYVEFEDVCMKSKR